VPKGETTMLIIGLLLVAAAITVGIDIAVLNNYSTDVEAFGQVWTSSPSVVFVAGVVTALVGAIGIAMMTDGMQRMRDRRHDHRQTRTERDRYAAELEHQQELAGGRPTVDERDTADLDLRDSTVDRDRDRESSRERTRSR